MLASSYSKLANLPWVLKLDEGKWRSSSAIFKVDVSNCTVFVEHIFDVFSANIGWQVPHIDSAVVVPSWASDHATATRHGLQANIFYAVEYDYCSKCAK